MYVLSVCVAYQLPTTGGERLTDGWLAPAARLPLPQSLLVLSSSVMCDDDDDEAQLEPSVSIINTWPEAFYMQNCVTINTNG